MEKAGTPQAEFLGEWRRLHSLGLMECANLEELSSFENASVALLRSLENEEPRSLVELASEFQD